MASVFLLWGVGVIRRGAPSEGRRAFFRRARWLQQRVGQGDVIRCARKASPPMLVLKRAEALLDRGASAFFSLVSGFRA